MNETSAQPYVPKPQGGWGARRWLFAAAALALLLAGIGVVRALASQRASATPPPARTRILIDRPAPGPHRIDYDRLDRAFEHLVEGGDMVGLAVAIVENGQFSFVKGYGVTQAGGDDPVGPRTVFRWASLSKGVAATLVAELAARKKFSLDDPVGRYAPSLKLPEGTEKVATIRDLLSHRLGIVRNAYDDKLEEGQNPRAIRTALGTLPPYCKPGVCHAYQNVAYDAASEIVETVTHQRYATQAKKRLFAPLGMDSASLTKEGLEASPSWARPHRGRHGLAVEDAYYRVPAAGGVNSSIFDLGLWMRAQMGMVPAVLSQPLLATLHAQLVETDSARPRRSPYDHAMSDAYYGLGWREFHYQGHLLVGHRGAVSGYRSLILFDPAMKAGIAMLWNSESPKPVPAQMDVMDMLYGLPDHDWMGLEKARQKQVKVDNPRRGGSRSAR